MIPIKPHPIRGVCGDKLCDVHVSPETNGLITATHIESLLHEGYTFEASAAQTTSNADIKQTIISFKTSSGSKTMDLFIRVGVSAQAWFYLYENPTIAASGGTSAVVAYNRNRTSLEASGILDSDSTTGQADYWDEDDAAGGDITLGDGTALRQELLSAGRTSFATYRASDPWILKPNTNYAVVVENEGAAANIHNILLKWSEH